MDPWVDSNWVVNTPLHPREQKVFTTGSFGVTLRAHPVP